MRREGRAVRRAVEGLRGAAVLRAAAWGEGLLPPAGPHRAGGGIDEPACRAAGHAPLQPAMEDSLQAHEHRTEG